MIFGNVTKEMLENGTPCYVLYLTTSTGDPAGRIYLDNLFIELELLKELEIKSFDFHQRLRESLGIAGEA